MTVTYDKYYQTENLFGAPYPELVEFFASRQTRGRVLDIGCGQGRDAIAIAGLGYEVLGIDNSAVGIDQMLAIAKKEGLSIEGKVADIFEYTGFHDSDFILYDSMFHFLKKDRKKETGLVERTIEQMRSGAELLVCIQDSGGKVQVLMETIEKSECMVIEKDLAFNYVFQDNDSGHSSSTPYRMIVGKKE